MIKRNGKENLSTALETCMPSAKYLDGSAFVSECCYGTAAPVATAIFSTNGSCGDWTCEGSFTLDEYTLVVSGGTSTEAGLETGVREATPLEAAAYSEGT